MAASTPLMTAGLDSLGALDLRKELSGWVGGGEMEGRDLAGSRQVVVHVVGGTSMRYYNATHSRCLAFSIRSVFGVDLPATLMFDYPTIETMAEELAGHASNVALDLTVPAAAQPPATPNSVAVSAASASSQPQQPSAGVSQEAGQSRSCCWAAALDKAVPPPNPNAPTLTLPGYFTVPSLKKLQRLSDADLRAVPGLVIGREGLGEVSFLRPGGWQGRCRKGV